MNKRVYAIILILSIITMRTNASSNFRFLENEGNPKLCCENCKGVEQKYYSIDPIFNFCGECCMDPKLFWVYKVFEPSLTKADTNSPCADRKYTVYKSTPTHGVWPITMTLDLFDKEKK